MQSESQITNHFPSADEILEQEKKVRPLTLDPIVVASFGDLFSGLKDLLTCLSYKAARDTSQSKPPNGPGGSGTGTVSQS